MRGIGMVTLASTAFLIIAFLWFYFGEEPTEVDEEPPDTDREDGLHPDVERDGQYRTREGDWPYCVLCEDWHPPDAHLGEWP